MDCPEERKYTLLWPEPSPKLFSSVRSSPKFVIKPWTLMLQPQTMPFKLRLREQKILQSRHSLSKLAIRTLSCHGRSDFWLLANPGGGVRLRSML